MTGDDSARAESRLLIRGELDDRIGPFAYLGKSDAFDRAIADFAAAYSDLNESDYRALAQAVRDGRVKAEEGI